MKLEDLKDEDKALIKWQDYELKPSQTFMVRWKNNFQNQQENQI